jgi:putative MATE family efflux protein
MSESLDPEAAASAEPVLAGTRWRDRDHTQGSLVSSLAMLALPLMASSLVAGVLFQLVDLKLVSGLGERAMTAVIITNQSIRQIVFMLIMGASFGAQGLIARSIGQSDRDRADHVAGQTVMLGLALSAIVAAIGLAYPEQLLAAMNVSPEVLEVGIPYVRLVLLMNFGFVFINLFNAILNGAGDTATPFVIGVVQTLVSLVAEWALIYGRLGMPRLGITGVALGLAAGQLVSMALISRVLFGGASRVHVRARHMRPDPAAMRQILGLSWPPAVQMLGGFLVTVFFIRMMGDFGDKAQAAYSIGLRIGMIAPMICFPLAGAVATIVGQSLGADDPRRAWRAMGVGLLVHAGLMWSLAIALYLFRVPFLMMFTQDPEVIAIGDRMLVWQSGQFALLAFFFVFFRSLQGAGDVLVPMAISIANSVLLSLPLGIYLAKTRGMGPDGLFVAQFISTAIGTVLIGSWVATGRWTTARDRVMARAQASG